MKRDNINMESTLEELIILKEIQTLRSKLIKCGMEMGFTHPVTIELSQCLDKLLNEYSLIKTSSNKGIGF